MRRAQKQQIENIIKVLVQVHNEIKKALEVKKVEIARQLLQQCQEGAIEVGKFIENVEGERFVTISLLEDYCEVVFRVYEEITQTLFADSAKVYKLLQKSLIKIENSVRNDIKIRWEAVFFPYKASMWDSLESVWKAADEDPECDAYVIPIPYFDKNPNGSFREMHYEENQYPDYVPITKFDEFDLDTHYPDMIFIHNPYDDCNYVTSVHPSFYSRNLKKYTDRLIYIPYFVSPGMLGDDFCATSGCLNADVVIVQSESVRQNYIHALHQLKQADKQEHSDRIEKKIVALGSPKLEKASKCMCQEYDLPDKWRELIENSDGTRKKVVFYNTSLGTILQESERYIQKMRMVFHTFLNLENVVLWWRPHPLCEETLRSMRPKLLTEYKKIVEEYQNGNWGIFDDTADLYRALACSDAYYGDRSSVTMLFSAAKKPVMIQNMQNDMLSFENFFQAKDSYWFTAFGFNGLFRLDSNMDKAEFMGCFSEENSFRLYSDILEYNDSLIFTPFAADAIAVYRMDTNEFVSIPLKQPQNNRKRAVPYSKEGKFKYCASYGKYAFMFPSTYPAIIKFNMDTLQVEYLYEPINILEKMVQHKNCFYFQSGIEKENVIRLWCVAANALAEFNMVDNTFEICYRLNRDGKYIEAVSDGENYWLIPCNNESQILKLSGDFLTIDTIEMPDGIIERNLPFLHAVCKDENMWIFPRTAKNVVRIPITGNRAEIQHIFDVDNLELQQEKPDDWRFFFAEIMDETLFAFNNFSQELFAYDISTGCLKKKSISTDICARIENKLFFSALDLQYKNAKEEADLYIYESCRTPFFSFLDIVQKTEEKETLNMMLCEGLKKVRKHTGTPENEGIGSSIYEYAKDYV